MKKRLPLALGALLAWVGVSCGTGPRPTFRMADYPGTIRIACVGDSITFGAEVENRETNCYPAVLGRLLGSKFETRNFGVSGATLLRKGDQPYWNSPEFAALATYAPDLIIILLGTNDTKPQNWAHQQDFVADAEAMIDLFAQFPKRPKIWICLPVPVYETRWGINDEVLVNGVIPALERAAQEKHLPVIDLYESLNSRPDLFADKVHPNAAGAERIARTVESALLAK
jgi:acyl-CoA thioesterase-1